MYIFWLHDLRAGKKNKSTNSLETIFYWNYMIQELSLLLVCLSSFYYGNAILPGTLVRALQPQTQHQCKYWTKTFTLNTTKLSLPSSQEHWHTSNMFFTSHLSSMLLHSNKHYQGSLLREQRKASLLSNNYIFSTLNSCTERTIKKNYIVFC